MNDGFAPPRPRTNPASRHVIVIGGGASGVLMAVHLLANPNPDLRLTIIEPRADLGRGLAYSTRDPDHLLNTRVQNMSAFPDDPQHFLRWLTARNKGAGAQDFVSRQVYGAYLSDLLLPWTRPDRPRRLQIIRAHATRLDDRAQGVQVSLDDGQVIKGDAVYLATGHVMPPATPASPVSGAWDEIKSPDPSGRIIVIGSGLSMVDQVLSLLKSGHRGPILALSRRGLLPRSHAPTTPLSLSSAEVPFGARLSQLCRWTRQLAARAEAQGGSWRDAVDAIRPHVQALWRALPMAERARFLRHGATWWDVHRHRIPPASEARIRAALASGQLQLQRGSYQGTTTAPTALRFIPPGQTQPLSLPADRIIDCRGIRRDPERHASPLVKDLLARGKARIDPLRLGLEVDTSCRLIDRAGRASDRIMAIGPVSRAAFWEITAIPDIREQTSHLACLSKHHWECS